jgi:hypothetical protein
MVNTYQVYRRAMYLHEGGHDRKRRGYGEAYPEHRQKRPGTVYVIETSPAHSLYQDICF